MVLRLKNILEEGAWDKDMKTSSEARRLKNITSRDNFKKSPFQYFFNPFVRGPLSHLTNEAYDGISTILYKIAKNKDSDKIKSFKDLKVELDKELKKLEIDNNPWEKDIRALIKGIKLINKTIENIKDDHFMNWLINPFVKGNMNAVVNHNRLEDLSLKTLKYSKLEKEASDIKIEKLRNIQHKRTLDILPKTLAK